MQYIISSTNTTFQLITGSVDHFRITLIGCAIVLGLICHTDETATLSHPRLKRFDTEKSRVSLFAVTVLPLKSSTRFLLLQLIFKQKSFWFDRFLFCQTLTLRGATIIERI